MSSSLTPHRRIQDSTGMKLIFIHPTRFGISSRASCWFRHDNLHSSQCKYQHKAKNVIYQKEMILLPGQPAERYIQHRQHT
jgi:hypothetical protein